MSREFTISPGTRESLPLFIGLVGPSSSGKTRSALRLAVGMQSVVGGEIVFINTEGKRGTMDLDLFKKKDGSPAIKHMAFDAPYASLDYLDAILQARASGAKTIVIDSLSHEHEQEGGMLDYQEQELTRMAGDDYRKRESMQMLAWGKPKAARRKLLTRGIMQTDVNIIACFRAKETSKPVKVDGKNKVVAMGFMPIAGDEFVFEMALSCLLLPGSQGVPTWHPEHPGEKIAVKRPDHLADIVRDGEQLTEEVGARLARWATERNERPAGKPREKSLADIYALELQDMLKAASTEGKIDELNLWWSNTGERRMALNIEPAREEKMRLAVMKVVSPDEVA